MTPIERACERAMHRMNESINRSAGQHMRAVRKAHAPVIEQAAPVIDRVAPVIELVDTDLVQAYALVSVALVGAAVTVAIAITLFNQP